MEPRLKSSIKWSPFPEELKQHIVEVLAERFAEEYDLEGWKFEIEGFIYPEEIISRIGLRTEGQLRQHNFEISQEYDAEKDNALELIQKSMDIVEHLFTEFLEEGMEDSDLEKNWQTMPHQKRMYHYRYSTVNTHLESEADRLLEEYEKKLVYEKPVVDPGESKTETLH